MPANPPTLLSADGVHVAKAAFAPQRWWRIMPLVFVTYSLACLDRANFGFAAAGGMAADLGISSSQSALIGSFFLVGYIAFQVPGGIFAQRHSVKQFIFACLMIWGICATLTGMLSNYTALLITRFCLGAAEAAVLPAMLLFLSRWFTRAERSRANTLLILGNPVTMLWMSIVSGYLINALDWRWMFIIEGFPTIIWAFCWWMIVRERTAEAPWLTSGEQQELSQRLAAEQNQVPAMKGFSTAFRSRAVLLLSAQYFCWSFGFFGFVLWLPSILQQGSSLGMVQTGWLSGIPYLAAIVAMIAVSFLSDRIQSRRSVVWPCLLTAALSFAALSVVGQGHFWFSFWLLVIAGAAMHAPFGPFWALIPELLPQNVTGGAIALINSMGALGSFLGSYAVGYLHGATGDPHASYLLMAGALVAAVALMLVVPRAAGETTR